MTMYLADDGNLEVAIEAESPEDAAETYVRDGEYGQCAQTQWIHVHVWTDDWEGGTWHRIPIEPTEPNCTGETGEHFWSHSGVQGSGGGVLIAEDCTVCGLRRTTDTWASDPVDGHEGLRSVAYNQGE